jgi:hypothetical protein
MASSIRKNGLKKLGLGMFIGMIIIYSVYWLQLQGYPSNHILLIGFGAPALWMLEGMFQIIMNRSLSDNQLEFEKFN